MPEIQCPAASNYYFYSEKRTAMSGRPAAFLVTRSSMATQMGPKGGFTGRTHTCDTQQNARLGGRAQLGASKGVLTGLRGQLCSEQWLKWALRPGTDAV